MPSSPAIELQSRVAQIRKKVLPQYPPVNVLDSADDAAAPATLQSRLPRPSVLSRSTGHHSQPHTRPSESHNLSLAREEIEEEIELGSDPPQRQRLLTSTPPPTTSIKHRPRSALANRFLNSHHRIPLTGGSSPAKKGRVDFIVSRRSGRKSMSARKSMGRER